MKWNQNSCGADSTLILFTVINHKLNVLELLKQYELVYDTTFSLNDNNNFRFTMDYFLILHLYFALSSDTEYDEDFFIFMKEELENKYKKNILALFKEPIDNNNKSFDIFLDKLIEINPLIINILRDLHVEMISCSLDSIHSLDGGYHPSKVVLFFILLKLFNNKIFIMPNNTVFENITYDMMVKTSIKKT